MGGTKTEIVIRKPNGLQMKKTNEEKENIE